MRRVHGGAIPVERLGFEPGIADREGKFAGEKERIAKAALDELPDGGAVIFDAGTTTVRLAELLPTDRELTVVTHALPVAMVLAMRPGITLHLVGGTVRGRTLAAVGSWAERELADIHADVAFLGTNGLSVEHGLTTPDLAEAAVKRALVANARRTVVLTDHSKIGRVEFAHVVPLTAVDTVITDSGRRARARRGARGRRPPGGDRMIVTLTPNPSLDRALELDRLEVGEVNRADRAHVHPGGKGINVSRVLVRHGVASLAVLPTGGADGRRLVELLDEHGVPAARGPGARRHAHQPHARRARRRDHQGQRPRPEAHARRGRRAAGGRRGAAG